jgi:sodium-dependent phosphate cotransporter
MLLQFLLALVWLYIFLIAVTLMGAAFKLFGAGFSTALLNYTHNPVTALFIGILATSIVQSSSTVTSTVVAMVAAGTLAPKAAVPIVMGANIGTSVTSIIVAMGFVRRPDEFGRAISGSTVHDFFNVLVTLVLFPLEMIFHPLLHASEWLAGFFAGYGEGGGEIGFASPIKTVVGPVADLITGFFENTLGLDGDLAWLAGLFVLLLAGVLLFFALVRLTKTMKKLLMGRLSVLFDKTLRKSGIIGIAVGAVATGIVQSSSVTTSLLVPLVAAGIIEVAQAFPLTLGANIGTTVTSVLASLTGSPAGMVVAFQHVLFNVLGVLMVYPFPPVRRIPIGMALWLGGVSRRNRKFAVIYVVVAFFLVPLAVIFISRLF